MVTLMILRHGKAAQEEDRGDRDRPLTKWGKRAAELIGHLLRDEDLVPDHVISSSALRAKDTARRVAAAAKFGGVLDELDELYLAEPADYITAVKRLAVDAERVMVVGHNPGLEALALLLTGEPTALPPAGLVVCELPISNFSELSLGVRGEMTRFERPKDLED
ncbi:MAG: histidine phosphatase family protein [Pseudomonadota bacterium]